MVVWLCLDGGRGRQAFRVIRSKVQLRGGGAVKAAFGPGGVPTHGVDGVNGGAWRWHQPNNTNGKRTTSRLPQLFELDS